MFNVVAFIPYILSEEEEVPLFSIYQKNLRGRSGNLECKRLYKQRI